MAVTATPYNHTNRLFANGDVDLTSLKVMLVNGHTFDPTDTDLTGIEADEVHGNGWDEGGEPVTGAAITTVNTDDAKLDGDDISVEATGGAIGPADGAVLVDADNGFPLVYIDFGATKTADEGADFKVTWNAAGIYTWVYTP